MRCLGTRVHWQYCANVAARGAGAAAMPVIGLVRDLAGTGTAGRDRVFDSAQQIIPHASINAEQATGHFVGERQALEALILSARCAPRRRDPCR